MADDGIKWWPKGQILKYDGIRDVIGDLKLDHEPNGIELALLGVEPTRITEFEGNYLTNLGRTRICDLLLGKASLKQLSATYGVIGVGDTSTNATQANIQGQTSLQATTNGLYKPVDSAPTDGSAGDGTVGTTPGVISAQATFQTGDANFAWNEWCIAIGNGTTSSSSSFNTATATGIMMNRAVVSLGTKVSTAVWVFLVSVTIT